jgi:anti-sigma B factor antagonist
MSLLARVVGEPGEEVSIAAVEGEVDASNAGEVADRLRTTMTNRSTLLVVDLTATTYIDSAGINMLYELTSELEHRQQRMRLVVPGSSPISRMLSIAGLDVAVPVHETRSEALEQQP